MQNNQKDNYEKVTSGESKSTAKENSKTEVAPSNNSFWKKLGTVVQKAVDCCKE